MQRRTACVCVSMKNKRDFVLSNNIFYTSFKRSLQNCRRQSHIAFLLRIQAMHKAFQVGKVWRDRLEKGNDCKKLDSDKRIRGKQVSCSFNLFCALWVGGQEEDDFNIFSFSITQYFLLFVFILYILLIPSKFPKTFKRPCLYYLINHCFIFRFY